MISTVVVSALWIACIAVFYFSMSENDPAFAVKMTAPPQATVGDEILFQVEVTNPTDSALELDSIDFEDSLLEGFKVTSVYPAPTDSFSIIGATSYSFSKTLSAGETFELSFLLEAVKPGIWTGDVDFCDSSQSYVTSSATVRVNSPGSPEMAAGISSKEVPDPPFVLSVTAPYRVTIDEIFTLRVQVSNPCDSSLVLESIDFDESLSAGFAFRHIEPMPDEKFLDSGDPSLVWTKTLAPGESFVVSVEMKAVKVGIWTGDLSFWDEDSKSYVSSSVTIRVAPTETVKRAPVDAIPRK